MTNSAKLKLTESEFKRIAAAIKEKIYKKGLGGFSCSRFFDDAGDENKELVDYFIPKPSRAEEEVFRLLTKELCECLYNARSSIRSFYDELSYFGTFLEEPVEPEDLDLVTENGEVTL